MASISARLTEGAAGKLISPADRFSDWTPIGSGGSADVFKVLDNELGVHLAVKILKNHYREDQRYLSSLRREVLISRKLRHPNICPIHDLYEGDRGIGIVMDLIEGHDLKRWLDDNRGKLLDTMPSRLIFLRKICEALTLAHSHIVHRDLKPANIFLVKGNIAAPMIMDFGMSTPEAADLSDILEGGTPKYMAPEQFLRTGAIDNRADLFALGILAYEVLTDGQIPPCSLKDAHRNGQILDFDPNEIVAPSAFCAAIPPQLDRLIFQLMRHDPDRRPASAAEVSGVLETVRLRDPFQSTGSKAETQAVEIAGGTYVVGDKSSLRSCDQPERKVKLATLKVGVVPVTNLEYRRFLCATGYRRPALLDHPLFGGDLNPVVMVSWVDACAYARWAGGRLLSEHEWEVAAKGGVAANRFPWGEQFPTVSQANIDNVNETTTPVGSYLLGANAFGLSDCCGNVWEWCADDWDENLLKTLPGEGGMVQPQPQAGVKSIRGGSFDAPAVAGRTSFRHRAPANLMRADIGFRLAFDA